MTIAEKIQALYDKVALAIGVTNDFVEALPDCYDAVEAKGGTLPAQETPANLPTAIESIQALGSKSVKIGTRIKFSGLTYEDMGEELISYVEGWNFEQLLNDCPNVKKLDFSNITVGSISQWYAGLTFRNCPELVTLNLNFVSIPSPTSAYTNEMIYNCPKLRNITAGSWMIYSWKITNVGDMTRDSIVAFLESLPTPADNSQTITMGSTKLALLSNDDKAIATSKGWTLA